MTLPATISTPVHRHLQWSDPIAPIHQYRTLILAPIANDARLTSEFLEAGGMVSVCVADMEELCQKVVEGCCGVIVAEEAMPQTAAMAFFDLLRNQPPWSDLPVTFITTRSAEWRRGLASIGAQSNVTILERPFRPDTLVSTLRVALRSRERQYQVRNLLGEIEHARDAAERANRAKDEFLAALSHELRTPLNPVLLVATEGAEDGSLPECVRQDFEQIARNIALEARLIDDLLDLTRITQGKLVLTPTIVDANTAIRSAVETTELEFSDKRISTVVKLEAAQATILADPVRFQQVLWNVLKNAAKFTPAEGAIWIETTNRDDFFVIKITDNGIGMDRAELSRVFGAFVQGNHARADGGHRFGGLGLGLAISQRLMDMQQGSIDASSEGPGRGSTFTVRFPLAPQRAGSVEPVRSSNGSRPPIPSAMRKLLLVEDHQPTRLSLKRLLERRSYQVEAVGTLAEARAALANHHFELMLSDLGLPDGSGLQLMSELNGHSDIKGIALSGYGMETDIAQSRKMGFLAHLTKPVTIQALDAALAEIGGV